VNSSVALSHLVLMFLGPYSMTLVWLFSSRNETASVDFRTKVVLVLVWVMFAVVAAAARGYIPLGWVP
jgi:hypothetical protein